MLIRGDCFSELLLGLLVILQNVVPLQLEHVEALLIEAHVLLQIQLLLLHLLYAVN